MRSRDLHLILGASLLAVTLIFSPWGGLPTPQLQRLPAVPLVPLRAVGLVALGYFPLLATAIDVRVPDVSSPRSTWLLRVFCPLVVMAGLAVLVSTAAVIVDVDALGAVRNVLLGAAGAATFHALMGPLAFVPPTLASLFCAVLREQNAWWAITNQRGSAIAVVIAATVAVAALHLRAIGHGVGPEA